MARFRPNATCTLETFSAGFDRYGRQVLDSTPTTARCTVVRAQASGVRTSLRSDTSATQGYTAEMDHDAIVLFEIGSRVAIGQVMTIDGMKFEIKSMMVRRSVDGVAHHIEIGGDAWVSE